MISRVNRYQLWSFNMDLIKTAISIKHSLPIKTLLSLSLLSCVSVVSAKRLPPPDVAPVTAGGIVYSAPQLQSSSEQPGGFIEARTQSNQLVLWRKKIYDTVYNKDLERDVQDVYITTLRLNGKTLMIQDEKSRTFCLNTDSQLLARCG